MTSLWVDVSKAFDQEEPRGLVSRLPYSRTTGWKSSPREEKKPINAPCTGSHGLILWNELA